MINIAQIIVRSTKDACETYAECYNEKKKAYKVAEASVKIEERDRKAEWRGLKRTLCQMIQTGRIYFIKNQEERGPACPKQSL